MKVPHQLNGLLSMNKRKLLNIIIICWADFAVGLSLSIMAPFYPRETLDRGVSVTVSGIVLSAIYLANVILTPLCGKYLEKLGSRNFLSLGLLFLGLGNGIIGVLEYVRNPTTFVSVSISLRIVAALGDSMASPACYALIAKQVGQESQGKATSIVEAFFGAGTMFGPSIGGILYDAGGFKLPFFFLGGFSLLFAAASTLMFKDFAEEKVVDDSASDEENSDVKWTQILKAPGVMIGLVAATCAATGWQWYAASLEVHYHEIFNFTSTATGLILMAFGISYTLATPVFGYMVDRGFSKFWAMVLGNILIAVAFIFLGPSPPLDGIIGQHVWLHILSLISQGVGTSAVYFGSLMYMIDGVIKSGVPDKDQTRGMVTGLWVVCDCIGGYLGNTFGSMAYDQLGFEYSQEIMVLIEIVGIGILFVLKFLQKK